MAEQKVNPWVILGVITWGAFMSSLNNNIVNVALPSMAEHYGVSAQLIQWVTTAYFLTTGTFLVMLGWLSDVSGRRRVYLSGYCLFLLGATLAGLSNSLGSAILSRILQATGGAAIVANGMAIIAENFSPQQRGRALGLQGVVVGTASFFGPTVGGLLTGTLGWRYIFWANLPIGIPGLLLACLCLPRDRKKQQWPSFDWWGALFYTCTTVSFLWGVTRIGLVAVPAWALPIVASLLCLVLFIKRERQTADPMVDLNLFRILPLSAGIISGLAAYMVVALSNLVMPFYLQQALGITPERAGLLMTPLPIATMAVVWISGWLSDRLSDRGGGDWLTTLGMGIIAVATLALSRLGPGTPLLMVALGLGAVGVGLGIFSAPNNSEVLNAAPEGKMALTNSLLATSRHSGQMLGTTVSAVLFSQLTAYYALRGAEEIPAIISGVRGVYLAGAGLGALGLLFCTWRLVQGRTPAARAGAREA